MKSKQQIQVAGAAPVSTENPRGIGLLDLNSIPQMPLAQYYALADNFVNTQNAVYYDTAVYTAGTAITAGQKKALFTKGKAQDDTVVNTGVAIAEKGEYMTNMIGDGEFEGGTTFLLEQIAVGFSLPSEQPTTLGTRGQITAPNYTASAVISAAIHARAITEQFELQYVRNEEVKQRALLKYYPSPFGLSGVAGGNNAGFVQNGGLLGGRWNLLGRVPVLQSEDKFSFVIQPVVETWTPTISFQLRVELIGKVIKTFIP